MPTGVYKRISLEDRFWAKVNKKSSGTCWEWTATLNAKGYGLFGIEGRMRLAHRISWFLNSAKHPGALSVLHKCDNPRCVNPEHLFLGTQADNMKDMDKKGRRINPIVIGSKNPFSKLTEPSVRVIKRCLQIRVKGNFLAKLFRVGKTNISQISNNHTWKHVKI